MSKVFCPRKLFSGSIPTDNGAWPGPRESFLMPEAVRLAQETIGRCKLLTVATVNELPLADWTLWACSTLQPPLQATADWLLYKSPCIISSYSLLFVDQSVTIDPQCITDAVNSNVLTHSLTHTVAVWSQDRLICLNFGHSRDSSLLCKALSCGWPGKAPVFIRMTPAQRWELGMSLVRLIWQVQLRTTHGVIMQFDKTVELEGREENILDSTDRCLLTDRCSSCSKLDLNDYSM